VGGIAQITGHQNRLAARLLHPARRVAGVVLLLVQVREEHIGALAGVGDRDGLADTAVTTGDQGLLPGQPTRSAVAVLTVVGPGPQLRFGTRRLLLLGGLGHGEIPLFSHRGDRCTGWRR
jgi:hypothetical protein